MNCDCDVSVRCVVSSGGVKKYVCATGKCRFSSTGAIHASGYQRILPLPPGNRAEVDIVRFEAAFHPESRTPHVTASVAPRCANEALLNLLEDERFNPKWYVMKSAYLYPMESYQPLLDALSRFSSREVLVEPIPTYFFTCLKGATEVLEQHERNVDGDQSQNADTEDVVYSQLRSFQRRGVDFIIARSGRGMIADDMGLGKTIQAIAVAHHYRDEWPVLIICPVSLLENWAKEITRFCSIPASRIAILRPKSPSFNEMHSVVIVPYTQLKRIESSAFKVMILDESHFIKSMEAVRTKQAMRLCLAARRVVLLSGTPALSKPIELYPQLQAIVHPTSMPSMRQFSARYCNAHMTMHVPHSNKGHSNLSELHILLQQFMIRRTKLELGSELPSKLRQRLFMYVTPKERESLAKDVAALRSSFGAGGSNPGSRAPNAFELKGATARAKIPAVQDYVRDTVEKVANAGEKIIFFAHHQTMMEAIRSAVEQARPAHPVDYITIAGDTPPGEREKLTTHFRESPYCYVAVLSMHSCGVGHNLTCASTVVFAELDWNPTTHLQCEDRVHRMGQSSPCCIYYLFAEGTADSVIWPMLDTKLNVTNAVLEDKSTATVANGASSNPIHHSAVAGAWTAEAETRHIARTDLCLTPSSSDDKKQTTLEGFLSNSGSRSRPLTQTQGSENNHKPFNAVGGKGDEVEETSPRKNDAAPVFLDVSTLRQRREANRQELLSSQALVKQQQMPLQPKSVPSAQPSVAVQRQSTLTEAAVRVAAPHEETVRPAATRTRTSTTAFCVRFSPNAANTPSDGRASAGAISCALSSPFVSKPQRRSGTIPPQTKDISPRAISPSIAVTVAPAGGDETVRLAVAPRSEEIRNYNARRTLFTLPTKRPRSEGETD